MLRQSLDLRVSAVDAALRLKEAEHGLFDIENERLKLEETREKAQYEFEDKIAEVQKRKEETIRGAAGSVTGALLSGRPGAAGDVLKGLGTQTLETIAGNAAVMLFKNIKFPSAKSGTTMGALLTGTLGGPSGMDLLPPKVDESNRLLNLIEANTRKGTDTQTAVATGTPLPGGMMPLVSAGGGLLGGVKALFGGRTGGGTAAEDIGAGSVGIIGHTAEGYAIRGPDMGSSSSTISYPRAGSSGGGGSWGGGGGGLAFETPGGRSSVAGGLFGYASGNELYTKSDAIVSGIATAGILYGAERGIAAGARQGGAKGWSSAAASGLGAAAAIDPEPISKAALAIGASVAGIVSSLLPDRKAVREAQINTELALGKYQAPIAQNRTQDIFGHYTDLDRFGKVRTSDLSAIPSIRESGLEKWRGQFYDSPGAVTSPFGDSFAGPYVSPGAQPRGAGQGPQVVNHYYVNAIDSKSFDDWIAANPNSANKVVHVGLSRVTGAAQITVRSVALS